LDYRICKKYSIEVKGNKNYINLIKSYLIYSIYNYRIKLNIKNIAIKKYYKHGKEYFKKIRRGCCG